MGFYRFIARVPVLVGLWVVVPSFFTGCGIPIPLPGTPVKVANGNFRLPSFASCTVWGFTPDELFSIQEAIAEWEIATDGAVSIRLDHGPSFHCEFYPTKSCTRTGPSKVGEVFAKESYVSIALDTKCAGPNLKELVMHELGHAFGLNHKGIGLMHPTGWNHRPCVDPATLSQFCELHYCSPGVRTTCTN